MTGRKKFRIEFSSWIFFAVVIALFLVQPVFASVPYDVLTAKGDPIYFDTNITGHVWIFGETGTNYLYDYNCTDGLYIPSSWTRDVSPGLYDVYIQNQSKDWIKEVNIRYSNNRTYLSSVYKSVRDIDITDMTPWQVKDAFESMMITHTHEAVEMYRVQIEEPRIEPQKMREVTNHTILVTGITNLENGTRLVGYFDSDRLFEPKDFARNRFDGIATGPLNSDRTFALNMSVDLQNYGAGLFVHNVTIYSDTGVKGVAPYFLWRADADKVPENNTIVYLSNGVIATPTPEVIVQTKIETVYQDRWYTATPTPVMTDAIGDEVPYPYVKTGLDIYGSVIAVAAAIAFIVIGLVYNRYRKR